ncbi:MAG TPA: hypothetical protein VKU02_27960 [Gemmataceae bacterium]|nr:hypothetical protein [Gemmataceae bacterium]
MATVVNPQRSVVVYLLLGILLIASAQLSFFLIGCTPTNRERANVSEDKQLLTRHEFEERIMGKTTEEVLHAVGRPNTTSQEKNVQYWHYANRTKDPLTGKSDSDAQVVFEDGHVRTVNY